MFAQILILSDSRLYFGMLRFAKTYAHGKTTPNYSLNYSESDDIRALRGGDDVSGSLGPSPACLLYLNVETISYSWLFGR